MAEPLPAFQGRHLAPTSPDPYKERGGEEGASDQRPNPLQPPLLLPDPVHAADTENPRSSAPWGPDGDLEFLGLRPGQLELACEMKLIGLLCHSSALQAGT